jgi:hypothetical protein
LTLSVTPTRRIVAGVTLGVALVAYFAFRGHRPAPSEPEPPPRDKAAQDLRATSPTEPTQPLGAVSNAPKKITSLQDSPLPEREYLEQLRALNFTDKNAALVLAEKGEEWYSDTGRNAEARRAMRITLLVDLDRMSEARALTREFIAKYPQSPYRPLVQGATGIHPRPSAPRP